jgi:type II secretion system (T2SS) protein G
MNELRVPREIPLIRVLACCLVFFSATNVSADLNNSQARKLLTRMAGFELTNGSVRVKTISATSATAAEVAADIRAVFNFVKDQEGRWRVAEIRTGPDRWEQIDFIANALQTRVVPNECTAPDPPFRGSPAVDPSAKRARCLLGSLLAVEVPSDAVRIQQVSPLAIPLASQPSALVVAWIRVNARIVNDRKTGWRVTELRTGKSEWVPLEPIVAGVDAEKQKKARIELEAIAGALEQFRKDRGFYVVSDNQAVVIDHLNPRYLLRVIRIDPWHKPYKYQGERDHFTLRSTGPDGKDGTSDDIALASRSR